MDPGRAWKDSLAANGGSLLTPFPPCHHLGDVGQPLDLRNDCVFPLLAVERDLPSVVQESLPLTKVIAPSRESLLDRAWR